MRRLLLPALVCALLCAPACAAQAAPAPGGSLGSAPQPLPLAGESGGATTTPAGAASSSISPSSPAWKDPNAPIPVPPSDTPPPGRRLSANEVLAIAGRLAKMKKVRAEYPGSYGGAYLKPTLHWQVSYFSKNGKKEIGQVSIDDISGRVLEQWTGFQVAWTMARGYPGAFGRHVNALYIWLPLCVLFFVPFFDFRRPLRLLHLDLLVLLSLSASLAFFNHGEIYKSVPLVYPPLVYLLARMLAIALRRGPRRAPGPLRLLLPVPWLALALVFLIGFRIALNVTDSNVIDVGYAGVIGAERIVDGKSLYGNWPKDNEHGDTYGPAAYEAYIPFQQIFGWSGRWDDLPASHAAAIVFDLLALALLFLIGRRVRGPGLGVALAYGWAAFPFTLYAMASNSNDTLVAVFVLAALLAATYRGTVACSLRGGFAALAGLTKFAPLALAPLLATHGLWQRTVRTRDGHEEVVQTRTRARELLTFVLAFVAIGGLASIPAFTHDSLHTIYERTFAYQGDRNSPFSVWGLYGGMHGFETAVEIFAVVLAVALAVVPRRADLAGLAAACGAVILAVQLGIEHWFYLYVPWFFPLVLVGFFARYEGVVRTRWRKPAPALQAEASEPARSSPPAFAASS